MSKAKPPSPPPSPDRIAAQKTGISAESKAAAFLVVRGYRILARRFRTSVGEIDIVARRRGTLVFVEVKARDKLDDAAYAVTPHQRRRIVAAAEAWLAGHDEYGRDEIRFDAILIAPGRLPRHLTAAFDVDG
jgi:putative endonuclease